jgi:two-component system chemotaxis response regulator CheY
MSRIVIVDDSGTARKFIRRCIEMAGCSGAEFVEAENGQKALEALRDGPVDLLLSDLNMPVMDGSELLLHIKADPATKNVTVLLVTSAENPALKEQLIEHGAFDVLSKPVSPALMFPILQKLSLVEGENP